MQSAIISSRSKSQFTLLLAAMTAFLPAARSSSEPEGCYAFLVGDVIVNCNGIRKEVTRGREVESFAVAESPSLFAFVVLDGGRATLSFGGIQRLHTKLTLLDLGSGLTRFVADAGSVISTCGSIIEQVDRTGRRDFATGMDLKAIPYWRFRCSKDRTIVAGMREGGNNTLYWGSAANPVPLAFDGLKELTFNISPDGSKLVFTSSSRLCVALSSRNYSCVDANIGSDDLASINNLGEVLVAVGTGETCSYKTQWNFSKNPPRDWKNPGADECLAIGYWRSGLPSVKIIEGLGRSPQWVGRQTGHLLMAVSTAKKRQR